MRRTALITLAQASSKHTLIEQAGRAIVTVGKRGVAVVLCEDGTAFRGDVDLSATKRMTIIEAARCVGLA